MPDRIALSWSGGKDSALALWALRRQGLPPSALLTVIDEASGSVAHHGIPGTLLRAQADAAGIPLVTVALPAGAPNEIYEQRLRGALASPPLDDVQAVAFGDLFLADLRAYREARMAEAGLEALFPLWRRETRALAEEFVGQGFRARIVSVDGDQLSHDFLGREFDQRLLDELPPGVDPCGENGEFHTCVTDGPIFDQPLAVESGSARLTERFGWLELRSAFDPNPVATAVQPGQNGLV